jgi:signal transduction histidine kinase
MKSSEKKFDILIVDDNKDNIEVLKIMLEEDSYFVRATRNGMTALKAVDVKSPDLILLDINMPGINGYEVCDKLKQNELNKDIPVIFISALTEINDIVKGFEHGGVDYISKPFKMGEVLSRVKTHLKIRSLQVDLEEKNKKLADTLDELKLIQSQLVHAEKMASLGVLATGLAHEINNPLNALLGNLNVLSPSIDNIKNLYKEFDDKKPDHDKIAKILLEEKENLDVEDLQLIMETMDQAGIRISGIINGLRSFARLDEGDEKTIDIRENIDSTLPLINHLLDGKITLEKEYSEIPLAKCNPGKLNQVILNLLTNAVHAIKCKENYSNELIKIKVYKRIFEDNKDYLTISVQDTGIGIKEDIKKKVFDPFFTTKETGKGIGLGLSISMGIMQSQNSIIDFDSNFGEGSTFRINLPIS